MKQIVCAAQDHEGEGEGTLFRMKIMLMCNSWSWTHLDLPMTAYTGELWRRMMVMFFMMHPIKVADP